MLVTGCLVPADFGTYLGRYLRFNRWDAITRPGRVLADTGRYVGGGRRMAEALAYTLAFGTVTLASSIPATSANVVRVPSPSTRRARHQHDGQHVEVVRGA